jgi:hypothetical protein
MSRKPTSSCTLNSAYTPDALGELAEAQGVRWIFALEVETGGFSQRLDNFSGKADRAAPSDGKTDH